MTLPGAALNVSDAAMGFLLVWGKRLNWCSGLLPSMLSSLNSQNLAQPFHSAPSKTLTAFHLSTHMVNLSQIPKALEAVYSYSNNPHLQINTHLTRSQKHKVEPLAVNEDQN